MVLARSKDVCARYSRVASLAVALVALSATPAAAGTFTTVDQFGSNPGALGMELYVPDALVEPAPLVVVLHGCRQNARGYAEASGWTEVADEFGLVLVAAEQPSANNGLNCFNWFEPADASRDSGEALSIRQMVDHASGLHAIDTGRVYVTGLSAGGAMTTVMLATYPDLFAGGAMVAGVPFRCANSAAEGLACMGSGQPAGTILPDFVCRFVPWLCPVTDGSTIAPEDWGDRVREASTHTGRFPRLSIWHGTADDTVALVNAHEAVEQWTNVHGLSLDPTAEDTVAGFPRKLFADPDGTVLVEVIEITGMDHGQPIDPGSGATQCGTAEPFLLDVDLCAARYMAEFWGLGAESGGS
jgi:poly(hydroxyalkanoate) depolymerase family esterase